jgi:hypothetical protein
VRTTHTALLALLVTAALATTADRAGAQPFTYTWNNSSSNWTDTASWDAQINDPSPNWSPNSFSSIAYFPEQSSFAPTINQPEIGTPISAHNVTFDTLGSAWSVTGAGSLQLGSGGIAVLGGGQATISVQTALASSNTSQTWVVDTSSGELVHSSTISGSDSLTLLGPGKFTFSGTNIYNGGTIIGDDTTATTLTVTNSSGSATGSEPIEIKQHATLTIGNFTSGGNVSGNITNGGTIYFALPNSSTSTFTNSVSAGNVAGNIINGSEARIALSGSIVASTIAIENISGHLYFNDIVNAISVTSGGSGLIGGSGVISANVSIPGGQIRGGSPGVIATLTVNGNVEIGDNQNGAGTLQVEVGETSPRASKLAISGDLNIYPGLRIDIITHTTDPLVGGHPYTITLASVSGSIKLDGSTLGNGAIDPMNYEILSSPDYTFTDVSLAVVGGDLNLTFTPVPVPEPGTVLGVAVGALAVGGFVRRRWRKPVEGAALRS